MGSFGISQIQSEEMQVYEWKPCEESEEMQMYEWKPCEESEEMQMHEWKPCGAGWSTAWK